MKNQQRFLKVIFLCFLFSIFSSQKVFSQDHKSWSNNLNIYEVNTRQYTASGTFNEFRTAHLDRLKEMGVGIIWFMPINPIGNKNRLGSLGSPYSVKDFLSVNPEFGTLEDFKTLVNEIHAKGMYVIIDWVANHTSWDNTLTTSHPEWYVKNSSGNFMPPAGTNWTDVIQLDYSKQGLRDYMVDAMTFWINDIGIDGFRCDAVSFMPLDFWSTAINKLKAIKPNIFMLAEDDKAAYQYVGFDMSYAWGMYGFGNGVLKRIATGSNNADDFDHYVHTENLSYEQHYRMYFTSNHDENSWYGTDFELFGNAAESFAVLTSIVNGMQLVYGGEEAGLSKRLAFFDKDRITWQNHSFANIYSTLWKLKKENRALWNGLSENFYKRIKTSNDKNIFAFIRKNGEDKILAIFNLSSGSSSFSIADTLFYGAYEDIFSKEKVSYNQAANMTLQGWKYRVMKKDNSSTNIQEDKGLPFGFELKQNYPNPFNPETIINYTIPFSGKVILKVYDTLGNEVSELINEVKSAGEHSTKFDGRELASGIYFYQLRSGNYIKTKKFLLMK